MGVCSKDLLSKFEVVGAGADIDNVADVDIGLGGSDIKITDDDGCDDEDAVDC